ncbi:hypothetical protein [Marinomonas sp. GJ51-6]|uniref:hypothetical protein n=1 Tax=Marinomonas sp. GJ51-6 TaxID=2992802 RepID=UPI00293524DF|nr:hypothetical protein [Marinomonas sp. GJ51-6]WOD07363.1 hypothetical protein ONZ50_17550 [Marinomonas sp. GJ51-6]
MARKANISNEEIYQACWELLERNSFPNIPRIADFFLTKDGRRCSNTTLMKAIAEWEEMYKEQQEHEFKDLDEVLLPAFKNFSRNVTKSFGMLLDEKAADLKKHQTQKQNATEGSYLSLSSTLIELQQAHEEIEEQHANAERKVLELEQQVLLLEQKNQTLVAQNQVLTKQLEQEKEESTELRLNLSQREVDLAKLDNKLSQALEEKQQAFNEITRLKEQSNKQEERNWAQITNTLKSLSSSVQILQSQAEEHKDRGTEK